MKSFFLSNILVFLLAVSCTNAQRNSKYTPSKTFAPNPSPFKDHLGINAFEWDFSDEDNSIIPPGRKNIMRSFGGFRHYMDWEKLESEEGSYTFNPVHSGGWNYDMIYEWCKAEEIEVLADLKTCPSWLLKTYPEDQRNAENVPAPYGLNRNEPASYVKQAKVAFQFAARYGHNKDVPRALMSVNANPRWTDDPRNHVRIGLGYINYIECDNERDKTWKGPQAHQNAEEYAANMSAFYDGHMGRLGKNAGVKTADPSMTVVMGGLSDPNADYVIRMINWCRRYRGYKPDGSVNLCFDVINYHSYNNDYVSSGDPTVGKAPELSQAARIADEFVSMSKKYAPGTEVWITEAGYDLNSKSPQRAIAIGNKTALITQADWILRSSFLYARHGLKRSFYYMLDDLDLNSSGPYASSGFAVGNKRRPVADYFFQTKKLIGGFHFLKNLNADPVVDVYGLNSRKIFVMFVPDEKNGKVEFRLNLGNAYSAKIYTLVPGEDTMSSKIVAAPKGVLSITLTETPVFVEPLGLAPPKSK
jgi:hypothetical protein